MKKVLYGIFYWLIFMLVVVGIPVGVVILISNI